MDLEEDDALAALVGDLADDFLCRLERGERPNPSEYAAQHPEAADLIRGALSALRISPGSVAAPAPRPIQMPIPDRLGDFRILRELGRGGMGIVYEAEHLSLGRRVALKVLPFAALSDSRLLQRFQNEARAAAALDHPHVVKVHAVGEDRGVHFLAMQLIDGRPLSDLIRERQSDGPAANDGPAASPDAPTATLAAADSVVDTAPVARVSTIPTRGNARYYRQVATWGVQAAEALEHAHAMGVVHRDVKPGNLLLDRSGNVWVADFGLAKLAASDAGLTGTGDVLGTLRYMSPEQALSKHDLVDHRTDVYALGATLYELLTGVPAVDGADKAEILRKIAFDEPVPLRKLDRGVPADLETIVLKCLSKDASDRYSGAGEVAADLHRFLSGVPVRARPITRRERAARWTRRHPRLTGAGIVMAMALIGAGWAADQSRLRAEVAVREASDRAEALKARGRYAEALSEARRAITSLPPWGSRALRRRVNELAADVTLLNDLEVARMARMLLRPDQGEFDTTLVGPVYADAFARYGVDVAGEDDEAVVRALRGRTVAREAAAALDDWGRSGADKDLAVRLNWIAEAVDDDPTGLMPRARRAERQGDIPTLRLLAEGATGPAALPIEQVYLADVLLYLGQVDDAARLLTAAQRHRRDDFLLNHLAGEVLYRLGRKVEAVPYFMVAAALRPDAPVPTVNLGGVLSELGRLDEAEAVLRELVRTHPDVAVAHVNFGRTLHLNGKRTEAEAAFRRAIELGPEVPAAHLNLSAFLGEQGRWAEGLPVARRAEELAPRSAPTVANLGQTLLVLNQPAEAEPVLRRALALGSVHPETRLNLAAALARQGKMPEAEVEYRKGLEANPDSVQALAGLGATLEHQRRPAEAEPCLRKVAEARATDAQAWVRLGTCREKLGRVGDAEAAFRKAAAVGSDHAEAQHALGQFLQDVRERPAEAEPYLRRATALNPANAQAFYNLGVTIQTLGRAVEAEAAYRQCLALRPNHAEAHCNLGDVLQEQGKLAEALGEIRRGHDLGSGRKGWRYPSAQWVAQAERLVAIEAALPDVVAGRRKLARPADYLDYATVGLMTGRPAAAAELFVVGFSTDPALADLPQVRYKAAGAALRAASAPTPDQPLDESDRARLRARAREWLAADLARLKRSAASKGARPGVADTLRHWGRDPDLHCVRDRGLLAERPEAERRSWQEFWAEVAAVMGPDDAPSQPGPAPRVVPGH